MAPPARPAAPQPRPATVRGVPSFSIKKPREAADSRSGATAAATAGSGAPLRETPVTLDGLLAVWDEYARTHRTETILSQTMRMSRPVATANPTLFGVTVQNIKQKEILDENHPRLLTALRDALANDSVDFTVEINQGEAPRHTLSDYELLEDLKKQHPHLRELIKTFKLRL